MFLDHDARSLPPRWEPPRRVPAGRRERTTTGLIALAVVLVLLAPEVGAALFLIARALASH